MRRAIRLGWAHPCMNTNLLVYDLTSNHLSQVNRVGLMLGLSPNEDVDCRAHKLLAGRSNPPRNGTCRPLLLMLQFWPCFTVAPSLTLSWTACQVSANSCTDSTVTWCHSDTTAPEGRSSAHDLPRRNSSLSSPRIIIICSYALSMEQGTFLLPNFVLKCCVDL
jgi:hypothetical protein